MHISKFIFISLRNVDNNIRPSLFNIYFNTVVAGWRDQCEEVEVTVLYKHGSKMVGDCTAKLKLLKAEVTESQFADDLALYAVYRTAFESIGRCFVQIAGQYGLTVSLSKTQGLAVRALQRRLREGKIWLSFV